MQSAEVQTHLTAINNETEGRDAVQRVIDSITAAADQLHAHCGGVKQHAKHGARNTMHSRPCNRWYTRDCAAARHALRHTERVHGHDSTGRHDSRQADTTGTQALPHGGEAGQGGT